MIGKYVEILNFNLVKSQTKLVHLYLIANSRTLTWLFLKLNSFIRPTSLEYTRTRPHILVAMNGVRPVIAAHHKYVWGGLLVRKRWSWSKFASHYA